jgi:hypothetical protein
MPTPQNHTLRVHLVHGTWPEGGWLRHRIAWLTRRRIPVRWMVAGCQFRRDLAATFPPRYQLTFDCTFHWRGRNSIGERSRGAARLSEHLARAVETAPEEYHLVVAHSHAGNVALDAVGLLESECRARVLGLVCLSTPFLDTEQGARPNSGGLAAGIESVFFAACFVGVVMIILLAAYAVFGAPLGDLWSWREYAECGTAVVMAGLPMAWLRRTRAILRDAPRRRGPVAVDILAIKAPEDEAYRGINFAENVALVCSLPMQISLWIARAILGPTVFGYARRLLGLRARWMVLLGIVYTVFFVGLWLWALGSSNYCVNGLAKVAAVAPIIWVLVNASFIPTQLVLAATYGVELAATDATWRVRFEPAPVGVDATIRILEIPEDWPESRHSLPLFPGVAGYVSRWFSERPGHGAPSAEPHTMARPDADAVAVTVGAASDVHRGAAAESPTLGARSRWLVMVRIVLGAAGCSLTVAALAAIFLTTYSRDSQNFYATTGRDGLGRDLGPAPSWYSVLFFSSLWVGPEQAAIDVACVLATLLTAGLLRLAKEAFTEPIEGRLWYAWVAATVLTGGSVAAIAHVGDRFLCWTAETFYPPRHAFLRRVRHAFEEARRDGKVNDRDYSFLEPLLDPGASSSERAILLEVGASCPEFDHIGGQRLWHEALKHTCAATWRGEQPGDQGSTFGDLVDVDERLVPSLSDPVTAQRLATTIVSALQWGADDFLRARRYILSPKTKLQFMTADDDSVQAAYAARDVEALRARLDSPSQQLLDAFRSAPFSLEPLAQCRMHEELLRLHILWSSEYELNGVDVQPGLGAGLGIVRKEALEALARRDVERLKIRD